MVGIGAVMVVVVLMMVVMVAVAAGLLACDLLADDGEVLLATSRDIDGATGGGVAGVQGQALMVVGVLEVGVDPAGGEGSGALPGKGGGIQEVVDVQVSKLHAHGTADTSSLVVGDGGVDDLQAVELARAVAQDGVHAEGTDTAALGGTGNDDGDLVGPRLEVDAPMAVVLTLIPVVRADELVAVVAVVPSDQRGLQNQLPMIIDRKGITRAGQVGDTEDGRADGDKVPGLANLAAGSAKVELVPAAIDVQLDGAAVLVVVVVMVGVALVLDAARAAGLADGARGAAAALVDGLGAAASSAAGAARVRAVALRARAAAALTVARALIARARAGGVGADIGVAGWAGRRELPARADIRVLVLNEGAAVPLGHLIGLGLGKDSAKEGAGQDNHEIGRAHV